MINKHLDKCVGNNIMSASLITTFRAQSYFITFENNL